MKIRNSPEESLDDELKLSNFFFKIILGHYPGRDQGTLRGELGWGVEAAAGRGAPGDPRGTSRRTPQRKVGHVVHKSYQD